jgi:hypothetical protein
MAFSLFAGMEDFISINYIMTYEEQNFHDSIITNTNIVYQPPIYKNLIWGYYDTSTNIWIFKDTLTFPIDTVRIDTNGSTGFGVMKIDYTLSKTFFDDDTNLETFIKVEGNGHLQSYVYYLIDDDNSLLYARLGDGITFNKNKFFTWIHWNWAYLTTDMNKDPDSLTDFFQPNTYHTGNYIPQTYDCLKDIGYFHNLLVAAHYTVTHNQSLAGERCMPDGQQFDLLGRISVYKINSIVNRNILFYRSR